MRQQASNPAPTTFLSQPCQPTNPIAVNITPLTASTIITTRSDTTEKTNAASSSTSNSDVPLPPQGATAISNVSIPLASKPSDSEDKSSSPAPQLTDIPIISSFAPTPPSLSLLREQHDDLTTKRFALQARRAELRTRKEGFEKENKEIMDERMKLWEAVLILEGEVEKEEAEVASMEVDDKRWELSLREGKEEVNGIRRLLEG
ncbi:hypothetical protein H0H93_006489 [Arthromyces matolae]|nr:hypothetical protein H0H93_006489 [Arthromyces matolae]